MQDSDHGLYSEVWVWFDYTEQVTKIVIFKHFLGSIC